jgi:hypothetical protein|tara:strand:- start:269 stop:1105 length:837 start_codon:yes stop_codon:yes gene_type:complete
MAQHDYNIADQTGLSFLSDINLLTAAIVSNNSGATEPATTFAYMYWADTTAGILKQRNAADTAWINLLALPTGIAVQSETVTDNAITLAKMAHGTDGELITYDAAGAPANVATGTSTHVLTSNGAGAAPTFQAAAGGVTIASTAEAEAGTNNTNLITPLRMREGFNASGSAPVYACRSWINFNGTGTPAIRDSGNVSSITDNGAGKYTVNLTTAIEDVNYSVVSCASYTTTNVANITNSAIVNQAVGSFDINISTTGQTNAISTVYIDPSSVYAVTFR